ncbi:MAG: hypothetical protein ACLFQS_05005 [Bacteroidales bacterium]
MEKKVWLVSVLILMVLGIQAQNYAGRMDDKERIAINPKIPDDAGIQGQAKNLLLSRMNNIINLNGLAAQDEMSYFAMVPEVSVLAEEITATAPPMHTIALLVSFSIVDNFSGNVFGETSMEVRGVDKSRERAYSQAFSSLNPRSGQFKVFMEKSKDQILGFYNTECDMVISTAQSLVQQDRKHEAIKLLESVPPVSRECHDMCMAYAGEIGPLPAQQPVADNSPNPEPDENGDDETVTVSGRVAKLRNLQIELMDVEFTGNDIDMTIVVRDEVKNREAHMRSYRFFDTEGNVYSRRTYKNFNLIRGIPQRYVFTHKGSNLDLLDTMLVLELNFTQGTVRFEDIKIKK